MHFHDGAKVNLAANKYYYVWIIKINIAIKRKKTKKQTKQQKQKQNKPNPNKVQKNHQNKTQQKPPKTQNKTNKNNKLQTTTAKNNPQKPQSKISLARLLYVFVNIFETNGLCSIILDVFVFVFVLFRCFFLLHLPTRYFSQWFSACSSRVSGLPAVCDIASTDRTTCLTLHHRSPEKNRRYIVLITT